MRDLQSHDPFAGEFFRELATQLHVFRSSENPFAIERIQHHVDILSPVFLPHVMVPTIDRYLALAIHPTHHAVVAQMIQHQF
jgi:hypothetical protein